MAAYLLDTNHLSPLITVGHPLRTRLLNQRQQGDTFSIPTPVLSEMLFGILGLPRAQQNMAEWKRLHLIFSYYGIDEQDAEQAAILRIDLRSQGWQLDTIDALIAVLALRYDLIEGCA